MLRRTAAAVRLLRPWVFPERLRDAAALGRRVTALLPRVVRALASRRRRRRDPFACARSLLGGTLDSHLSLPRSCRVHSCRYYYASCCFLHFVTTPEVSGRSYLRARSLELPGCCRRWQFSMRVNILAAALVRSCVAGNLFRGGPAA